MRILMIIIVIGLCSCSAGSRISIDGQLSTEWVQDGDYIVRISTLPSIAARDNYNLVVLLEIQNTKRDDQARATIDLRGIRFQLEDPNGSLAHRSGWHVSPFVHYTEDDFEKFPINGVFRKVIEIPIDIINGQVQLEVDNGVYEYLNNNRFNLRFVYKRFLFEDYYNGYSAAFYNSRFSRMRHVEHDLKSLPLRFRNE